MIGAKTVRGVGLQVQVLWYRATWRLGIAIAWVLVASHVEGRMLRGLLLCDGGRSCGIVVLIEVNAQATKEGGRDEEFRGCRHFELILYD